MVLLFFNEACPIPCFNYRKGIEKEEQVVETSNDNVNPAAVEATTDATSDVTKDPVVGDAQAAIDPTDANADAGKGSLDLDKNITQCSQFIITLIWMYCQKSSLQTNL